MTESRATTPVEVVFIAGSGRSGSTLLDRLLSFGADAISTGELGTIWLAINGRPCGCGSPILECEFWRAVLEDAVGHLDNARLTEYEHLRRRVSSFYTLRAQLPRDSAAYQRDLNEFRDILTRLYHSIGAIAGVRTIIDSTKLPGYGSLLASVAGVRVSTIQLVRDSRAVAFSWTRPTASSLPQQMHQIGAVKVALRWNRENGGAELLRYLTSSYQRVRYEDLARGPQPVLTSLGEKLGLTTPPISADNTVELAPNHMVRGNPQRFQTGSVQIREDAEWMTKQHRASALRVTALTWPLLLRYGYPLAVSS